MKRSILFTFLLLPFVIACAPTSNDVMDSKGEGIEKEKNIQTRNYKDITEDKLHPEVEDGYVRISSVLLSSNFFVDEEETTTYLYKLSCKDSADSFETHRFNHDKDGCYYAEISETQNSYIPNRFATLKNSNYSGSSVEITIDKIYKCITYRELYYSEAEQKIKIIDFDHVIPGLEEQEVNSLIGKSVDYSVYVDEGGIKSMNHGNLPFESELIINYINLRDVDIKIN